MSTWKKYGGIYHQENNNNICVYSIVADIFTLRESYYGTFDVCGEFHVSGNAVLDSNVKVNNCLEVINDISTNRLFVTNQTYHKNDVDISGNLKVNSGNLIVYTNVIVSGVIKLEKQLYLGNSGNAYLFGTDVIGNIGINTTTPIAIVDISSVYPLAFNVGTGIQEQLYSVPVQNVNHRGILLAANTKTSQIGFFNDHQITANINGVDGSVTYSNGGILTIDVSNNTNILSTTSISSRFNRTSRLGNISAVIPHVMGETVVIYDISSGPYLKPVYENISETTGNALSLIANDACSNTFMNIIAPNKQGVSVGGGVYPNDNSRSMGTIGWRDVSANYTPTINIVSGKSNIKQKTTVGINTHAPNTENYAFDVNGPIHINNGELTITEQTNIEIVCLAVGKTAPKNAVAIGTPFTITTSNLPYNYRQKILFTNDGGENWNENYDLSGDSIEKYNIKVNAAYVYDSSLTIIAGDNCYAYYTYNGYVSSTNNNAWQSIGLSTYNTASYSIKSIYVTPAKRAFFGIDASGLNSFIYWFDISSGVYQQTQGFDSQNNTAFGSTPSNQYGTFNLSYSGIKSIDGCGNTIFITIGSRILSIQGAMTSPSISSTIKENSYGNYNSIHVLDPSNITAAGNNVISFTTNGGTTWTDISTNNFIVNQIKLIDTSNAIAVCNSGIILTSSNWSSGLPWSIVSKNALNSSGNANRLTDSSYNLTNIGIVNSSNFYITKTIQKYNASTNTLGNTSIFHAYLPNLFGNTTNYVLDISGSIRTSGDINVNDGGKIASNNQTFKLLNDGVNQIFFGGDASNVYIGSLANSTVVANCNLTINDILRTNYIDSLYGNINYNPVSKDKLDKYDINIGTFNLTDASSRNINIGNFNTMKSTKNTITIGGDQDTLYMRGNVIQTNSLHTGPVVYLNTNGNLKSANSGLHIKNYDNLDSGYVIVSNDQSSFILKAPNDPPAPQNIVRMDLSNLIVPSTQYTGLVAIHRSDNVESNVKISTCAIDPSNIILSTPYFAQAINNDMSFNGNVFIKQNTYINMELNVTGNGNITANLNVTGNTNITSNLVVTGNTIIGKDLNVTGNANINANLNVTGYTNITSNLVVTGNTIIGKDLNVTGNANINSNLNVTGHTNITSNLVVTGNTIIGKDLNVTGNANINSNLNVTGYTNINSNLVVTGNTIIGKDLNVTGNANINANLNVTGYTNITSNLVVTGNTIIGKELNVTGNANITKNLVITGYTIIGNTLTVTGNTTMADVSAVNIRAANLYGSFSGTFVTTTFSSLTVVGQVSAASFNATSDRRLKSNIQFLSNQSKSILEITPVTYNWKVDGRRDIGFIAQDVYKTYPEIRPELKSDPSSNIDEPTDLSGNPVYYGIDYGKMTPFLWQGMRELIQRLEKLESENQDLRKRVEILEMK